MRLGLLCLYTSPVYMVSARVCWREEEVKLSSAINIGMTNVALDADRKCWSTTFGQAVRAHHGNPYISCTASPHRRVGFKISALVYCSLAGTAPVYLADECTLVTAAGRRFFRSAENRTYMYLVKRSRNQFGARCSHRFRDRPIAFDRSKISMFGYPSCV